MVGGVPQELARAQREIGLDSTSMAFFQTRFGYQADRVLATNSVSRLAFESLRWRFFVDALRKFDVFHFNAGMSLLPHFEVGRTSRKPRQRAFDAYARLFELRDLPILRRLGKTVFVTFQGSDIRQGDFCRAHFEITYANEFADDIRTRASDDHKRRIVAMFDRYANGIYAATPDLLRMLPPRAKLLPDVTVDLRDWRPPPPSRNARLLVIHAPSDPRVKGTKYVRDAIERLRADGVDFDFELVEGRKRDDARSVYERADLVVEQVLLGWYSVLATEVMALGKPVITYIREEDLELVTPAMRSELPVIGARPDTLYTVLKEWLTTKREQLPVVGQRSRAYVERWHDPLTVAAHTRQAYEDARIPEVHR